MNNLISGRKASIFAVFLALLALAAFLLVAQFSATAEAGAHEAFTGFWMAVDQTDGGFNKLSITGREDGTSDVGLSETHVSSCGGGRATLSGVGVMNAGDLVVPITIQCLSDKKNSENDPIGEAIGPFPVTFVVLGANLIEFQFSTLRVSYHRVSSN